MIDSANDRWTKDATDLLRKIVALHEDMMADGDTRIIGVYNEAADALDVIKRRRAPYSEDAATDGAAGRGEKNPPEVETGAAVDPRTVP